LLIEEPVVDDVTGGFCGHPSITSAEGKQLLPHMVQSGSIFAQASAVAAASQFGRDGQACESPALIRSIAGHAAPIAGSVHAKVAKQKEHPESTHEPQGATLCQYVDDPTGADKDMHEFPELSSAFAKANSKCRIKINFSVTRAKRIGIIAALAEK
jgi:hypothetical protein